MCFLFVHSDTESFKDFAEQTLIPFYSVYDKGEPTRGNNKKPRKDYRISFDVSDADWDEIDQQKLDAIEFLKTHKDALRPLLSNPQITEAVLDFPMYSRLDSKIAMFYEKLPLELIVLASDLKIEIGFSVYAVDAFDDLGLD